MPFFDKDDVTLYDVRRDAEICGVDDSDNPLKCEIEIGTCKGNFQQHSPKSTMEDYGTADQSIYKLIIDKGHDINQIKKVKIAGYQGFYSVVGEPKNLDLFDQIAISLIKDR